MLQTCLYMSPSQYPGTKKIKFNMMVTTYEVLLTDIDELSRIEWQHLIVDEGEDDA